MPAPLPALLIAALLGAEGPAAAPPPSAGPPPAPSASPEAEGPVDDAPVPRLARVNVVERIELRGLEHTHREEVLRHVLVREGDPLDPDRVLLSRLRLLQLGWFSRVETRVERGSERGLVVLVIEVKERNTLLVSDLVFGSTGPQPFYGGLGLSQQNFLGRGFGLTGAFVYGGSPLERPDDPSRFTVRLAFLAPDVGSKNLPPLVFGASALFLRGEEFACGDARCDAFHGHYGVAPRIQYQRAGGEVTVGVRPGPFERLLASFRVEQVHAANPGPSPLDAALAPPVKLGWSTVSSLTGTYEVDTRDDAFLPREGFRGLASVSFSSALLGSDYEYSRYTAQLDTAYGLLRLPLRAQLAVGAVQGDAPFFDRFYAADYSYFAVGPALGRALELNFSTDSRYDAFVAMGGLEYAIPLWDRGRFFHRGYLALGARAVWNTARLGGGRTPISRSPFSADAALRLDTPIGSFNASLGYALDNAL